MPEAMPSATPKHFHDGQPVTRERLMILRNHR